MDKFVATQWALRFGRIVDGKFQRRMIQHTKAEVMIGAFREFDLEMDLMDARSFMLNDQYRHVEVSPDEYLETDQDAIEDMTEALQYHHSANALMPGCWGFPLQTPRNPDNSIEPWSGGFADNH